MVLWGLAPPTVKAAGEVNHSRMSSLVVGGFSNDPPHAECIMARERGVKCGLWGLGQLAPPASIKAGGVQWPWLGVCAVMGWAAEKSPLVHVLSTKSGGDIWGFLGFLRLLAPPADSIAGGVNLLVGVTFGEGGFNDEIPLLGGI